MLYIARSAGAVVKPRHLGEAARVASPTGVAVVSKPFVEVKRTTLEPAKRTRRALKRGHGATWPAKSHGHVSHVNRAKVPTGR